MSNIDKIFDEVNNNFEQWGIDQNPFTESLTADADKASLITLRKVFTGRDKETKSILNMLKGDSRRRILLYGDIGIGKSALMLSILEDV
jgi:predicted AAA+ superfamily ATPase